MPLDAHATSLNAPRRGRHAPIFVGVGVALVALVLLAAAWIDVVNVRTLRAAGQQERTTREMLQVSSDLMATLNAVESAQRGYVATGDASFLGGYAAAREHALNSLARLSVLASDRAPASQRLQSLGPKVHERLRFADQNIALRREQGFDAAQQWLVSGTAQQLTDAIRDELTALGAAERDRIDLQQRESERAYRVAVTSTVSAALLALLVLGATGWLARRAEANRQRDDALLRESQARLAAMVDSATDAIVGVDGAERIVLFNAAAERMFGCTAGEALGQALDRFIPPHARAVHAEHLRRLADSGPPSRTMEVPRELSGLRADGVEFPLEASISSVEIAGHTVRTAILRDISERRRTEDALKESEERLQQAVAVVGLGLFDHDHRRDEIHLSPRLRDIMDIELEHASALERVIERVHPDDRARIAAAITRAHDPAGDGTFATEHRILRRDGALRWVSAHARTSFDGEGSQRRAVRTIGAVVDITDRVEALAEVDRLQQRYRAIVDLSPNAIVLAEGGRIALANQACLELFGAERTSQLLGRDWTELVHSDSSVDELFDLDASERALQRHARIVRLDGIEREVEISAAAVPGHGEYAMQFVINDVTTRNRNARMLAQSREELRRLSANLIQVREEERRRIARELHDELGQRLSAIKMHIVTLMAAPVAEADTGHRLAEAVGMVNELVKSVRRIAADLRPAMLDDLGLHAAIDWLAAESSTRSGLHVTVRCDADCDLVNDAAKTAVYRFVQEALTNVQRHAQARQVDIDLRCDKRELVACVADDGVGIAHAATRKPGSYGLIGMRERARQLGGTLTIDRRAAGGSRIEMHIPVDGVRLPSASTTPGDL